MKQNTGGDRMKVVRKSLLAVILGGLLIIGIWLLLGKEKLKPKVKEGGEETNLKKMENKKLKVLFVLAPKDFRDEEFLKPEEILTQAGIETEVASKGVKEASGVLGAKVKVDKDITNVNVEDYNGLIFVGGPGTTVYFTDQQALALAREAFAKGKTLAAICIAPSILANAGVLSGKKATAFPSEKENLLARGAIFTGEEVTIDEQIITASGPQAADQFGHEIKKALGR